MRERLGPHVKKVYWHSHFNLRNKCFCQKFATSYELEPVHMFFTMTALHEGIKLKILQILI